MTTEHEASRTLVKSPPELWAECSDAGSLARHLGEFGEITITRLEPETTVAWEGEHASGTVRIEPSGWGTRVTLTAQTRPELVEAAPDEPSPPVEETTAAIQGTTPPIEESSPVDSSQPAKEDAHATVEETPEEPHPVPASEDRAFRIRWRRMRERMRGVFRGPETGAPSEIAGAPAGEPVGSTEPPEVSQAESAPDAPSPSPGLTEPEASPPPGLGAESELDPEVILTAALDSLGQAHHRPFSRA